MSDAPDDLGIPMKPARTPGQAATVAPLGRAPALVPPGHRSGAPPVDAARPPDGIVRPGARDDRLRRATTICAS